jgi:hypothetical protein
LYNFVNTRRKIGNLCFHNLFAKYWSAVSRDWILSRVTVLIANWRFRAMFWGIRFRPF